MPPQRVLSHRNLTFQNRKKRRDCKMCDTQRKDKQPELTGAGVVCSVPSEELPERL